MSLEALLCHGLNYNFVQVRCQFVIYKSLKNYSLAILLLQAILKNWHIDVDNK